MGNITFFIRCFVVFCCLSFFLAGCEKEAPPEPAKPKVVSQKISIQKQSAPKAQQPAKGAAPAVAPSSGQGAQKVAAAPKTAPAPSVPATKAPEAPKAPATSASQAPDQPTQPEEVGLAAISYDPAGKIDPFAPLFRAQPPAAKQQAEAETGEQAAATASAKKKKKRRVPRTPLEKMDLSQLKLVGIIRTASGNRALVQDASGKGYVLNKGTYIGINSGFVTRITRDKVIVEEEVEDIYGKISLRERELVLQKPVGEI